MALLKDLIVYGASRFLADAFGTNIYADKHITNGGTATQFLKGDGTLDSNTYATTSSLSGYVPTSRKVNGQALSADVTLTLDNINDGSSRKLANYVLKAGDTMSGSLTATSFIKSGGTSSQFLKADGSVDSNTYLTSASLTTHAKFADTATAGQVLVSKATNTYEWKTLPTVYDTKVNLASNTGTTTQAFTLNSSADRTMTVKGDGTYLTGAVSGSANSVTVTINHVANTTAGTAGQSGASTGVTFNIPYVTYNAGGHITAGGTHEHSITGAQIATILSGQTVGTLTVNNLTVPKTLLIPAHDPSATSSTDTAYLWLGTGLYSEIPSGGGGGGTVYDLTIRKNSVSLGTYNLGTAAADINIPIDWNDLASHPTTLGNYGITDAKIETPSGTSNRKITLGSNNFTIYSWALASAKPSYTLDEVADGSTRKLANYLPLAGGTMTGNITMDGTNIVFDDGGEIDVASGFNMYDYDTSEYLFSVSDNVPSWGPSSADGSIGIGESARTLTLITPGGIAERSGPRSIYHGSVIRTHSSSPASWKEHKIWDSGNFNPRHYLNNKAGASHPIYQSLYMDMRAKRNETGLENRAICAVEGPDGTVYEMIRQQTDGDLVIGHGAQNAQGTTVLMGGYVTIDSVGSITATNSIIAPSFVKTNGTSTQFLKADGSVDSSTYLTGITKAQVEAVLTGNITSHTHSYLPLTGGTITSTTVIPLILNSTHQTGQQSILRLQVSGADKAAIGWQNTSNVGTYLQNLAVSGTPYVNIASDGKFKYKNAYEFYHTNNLTLSTLGGVPTTRKVNNKALSSDITLSLDDVADGSTRKLADYVPKKDGIRFYPYIGTNSSASSGAQWFKVTLSHNGQAAGANRWFMLSMDLVINSAYSTSNPPTPIKGTVHLQYYFSYNNSQGVYSAGIVKGMFTGMNYPSLQIKYDPANPAIFYVKANGGTNIYNTLSIENLMANDSSANIDYSTTTIEAIAETSIPSSASTVVPIDSYLPLTAGSSYPLTGDLYLNASSAEKSIYMTDASNNAHQVATLTTAGNLTIGNNQPTLGGMTVIRGGTISLAVGDSTTNEKYNVNFYGSNGSFYPTPDNAVTWGDSSKKFKAMYAYNFYGNLDWSYIQNKPTYTLDNVADGSTRKLANYLPLSGGTLTKAAGTSGNILDINNTTASSNVWTYYKVAGANKAAVGYYTNFAFISNEASSGKARIGVADNGTPQYWPAYNSAAANRYTLWHANNSNLATVSWSALNLSAAGTLSVGSDATVSGNLTVADGKYIAAGTPGASGANNKTNYISAGPGYSTGSGRYGVKVLTCDQNNCQSGLGQDLACKSGWTNNFNHCMVACHNTDSKISFVTHPVNSTTYTYLGGFSYTASGTAIEFNVNGVLSVAGASTFTGAVTCSNNLSVASGLVTAQDLTVTRNLVIPKVAPTSPDSTKYYLYVNPNGNYSE